MGDAVTEEGWHTLDDGEKLYSKTWKPSIKAKARLVFVHGFSDHCASSLCLYVIGRRTKWAHRLQDRCYYAREVRWLICKMIGNAYGPFFPLIASHGIEVFAFDQRGWGRSVKSPKQKGLTGTTGQVLDDISSVLRRFIRAPASSETDLPLFLMGHSMGGAEVLHFIASKDPKQSALRAHIRGYLTESPLIGLHPSTAPWRITVAAGRLASKVMPHMHLVNPLNVSLLSRDGQVGKRMRADELCHDTGTLEGLAGMLDRAAALHDGDINLGADSIKSLFVSHGTEDGICSFEATKKWVEQNCHVKDLTWKIYNGWYHRLHDELDDCKETYANDVANWILARLT